MATNRKDVELSLNIKTTGTEALDALRDNVAGIGTEAGDASPELARMAREVEQVTAATRAARDAVASQLAAEREARGVLADKRDELTRLRLEYQGAARNSDEYRAKETALKTAILDASRATRDAAAATRTARDESTKAAAAKTALVAKYNEASAAAQRNAKATDQAGLSLDKLGAQLRNLQGLVAAAFGGSVLTGMARDVAATADAYNNLGARIRLVTGEGEAFTEALGAVGDIATRTGASLEATGTLFTRIATAGREMGLAQADALALTESINQALAVSGASAQASDAALTQLIQGLQSGVLRGEEFNSVMEQAPRLARALADGLNVTVGELRGLAEQGRLTSQTVIGALQGQAATIRAEFDTLPPTVGRALQGLSTAWTQYIGQSDQATGASKAAAGAINALSANLNTLVGLLIDAGQAGAAFAALRLAQHFAGIATAAATAATSMAATAAATDTAAASAGRFAAAMGSLKTFALVAIIANFKDIGTWIGEAAAKLAGYKDRTEELIQAEKVQAEIAAQTQALRARGLELDRQARDAQFELSKAAGDTLAKFDTMTKAGKSASEAVGAIGKDFDLASIPGVRDAGAVLDKLAADGRITAGQFQAAWAAALKGEDLARFEVVARAAFAGTAREAERMAQVLDVSAREAIRRTGLDFDTLAGGMSAASRSAINDVEAIVTSLERLDEAGVDTARALAASLSKAINTADTGQAVDTVVGQIERLRAKLGETVTNGLLDQAKSKAEELRAVLDKTTPGVNSLKEALSGLGVKADTDLKAAADRARELYEAVKANGGSARETTEAFKRYAEASVEAGGRWAAELLRTEAAIRGVKIEVDATGRAIVKGMDEGADATRRTGEAAGAAAGKYGDLAKAAETAAQSISKVQGATYNAEGFALDSSGGVLTQALPDTFVPNSLPDGSRNVDFLNQGEIKKRVAAGTGFANAIGTATPGNASGKVQPVVININGTTTRLNVASRADADTMTGLLEQLAQGKGVAAY